MPEKVWNHFLPGCALLTRVDDGKQTVRRESMLNSVYELIAIFVIAVIGLVLSINAWPNSNSLFQ